MEDIQLQGFRGSSTLKIVAVSVSIILFAPIACSDKSGEVDTVPSITTSELKRLVDSGANFFMLDVRTEAEFSANRLSFAHILIPYDSLEAYLDHLPQDKDSSYIYCFCRTGRRSGIATKYLLSIGYRNVYNVAGGIVDWQRRGWETVSNEP